jgi:hypothetical protein
MSLLDRYLHAVRAHLPAGQQDDIIAELGEDLRAQLEEREAALGRPLTEDEEAALLRPHGRPIVMAARYLPRQHLIGPALFPYYWATLKTALSIAVAAIAALSVAFAVSGRPFGDAVAVLWKTPVNAALAIFTWVTLAFAAIELVAGRVKKWDAWDPRHLPHETAAVRPVSRWEVGFDLAFSALWVAVWAAWPRSEFLRTLADSGLELAAAWAPFYLPILVVAIASLAAKAVVLVRPEWTRFRLLAGIAGTLAGLVIMSLLLRAGELVVPTVPAAAHSETLVRVVNATVRVSFVIAMVISAATTAREVWRYLRGRRRVVGAHRAA